MEQEDDMSVASEYEEMASGGEDLPSDHQSISSEEADKSWAVYESADRIEFEDFDDIEGICDNENEDYKEMDSEISDDENDEVAAQATTLRPSFQNRTIDNLPVKLKRGTTSNDFLLPILAAAVRFNESYEQTLVHLRIVKSRLEQSTLPMTKKELWCALDRDNFNITRHIYCYQCRGSLGTGNTPIVLCSCKACGPGQDNSNVKYFLQLNVTAQILAIPNIAESLKYKFNRIKRQPDSTEDLYDGIEYKKLSRPGEFSSNPYNFSFTFNTDGCKITNSSSVSGWPLYAQWNELPLNLRAKHMILVAVFVDDKQPPMNVFMKPFVDELNKLYQTGVVWYPTPESPPVTSKFMVTIGTEDSLHWMTHITDTVRNWGPTWATDAYKYESGNKRIVEKVSSPHCRVDQIANRFLLARFID